MMDQNNLSASATPLTPPSPQSGGDNMLAGQIIPDPTTTTSPTGMSDDTMGTTPQPSTVPGMTAMPSAPVADTMSVPTPAPGMPSPVGMGANALDPMSGAATVSAPSSVSNPTVEPTTVPTPLDMPAVPPAESVVTPMASAIAADTTSISDTGTGLNAYVSSQKNSLAGSAPAAAAAADPLNIADSSQPQPTTNPLAASVSSAVNEPASTPTSATPTMDLPSADTMSGSAPSSFVLDYNKPQSTASTSDVPAAPKSELAAAVSPIAEEVPVGSPATNAEPTPSSVLNDIGIGGDPTDSTEVGTEMKLDLNAPTPDPVSTALPGVVEMPGPEIGTQPSNVAPLEQGLDTINMQKGADAVASQPDIGLNQTIANMVTNENQSPLTQPQAVEQPAKKKSGKVFVMFSLILVVVVVALVLIMVGLNFIG